MTPKTTIEFALIAKNPKPGASAFLKSFLLKAGAKFEEIAESNDYYSAQAFVYPKSLSEAKALQRKIHQFRLKNISVRIKSIPVKSWQEKWKKDFRQFRLTKSIDIVPAWQKKKYQKTGREVIFIETISAFGTGLHETTKFMAELIEREQGNFESFLDIGTGTGILALVASAAGARDILALDYDPQSITTARYNFDLNHVFDIRLKKCNIAKLDLKKQFDFVAANLITLDLIKFKRKILSCVKKGKYLAVSGISRENLSILKKAFRALSLKCLKVVKGKDWVAVLYKRN